MSPVVSSVQPFTNKSTCRVSTPAQSMSRWLNNWMNVHCAARGSPRKSLSRLHSDSSIMAKALGTAVQLLKYLAQNNWSSIVWHSWHHTTLFQSVHAGHHAAT